MRDFVKQLGQAILVDLLKPVIVGSIILISGLLVFLIRDNTQIALLILTIFLVLPTSVESILRIVAKGQVTNSFIVKDEQNNFYYIDNSGKARLIPDIDTLYYIPRW